MILLQSTIKQIFRQTYFQSSSVRPFTSSTLNFYTKMSTSSYSSSTTNSNYIRASSESIKLLSQYSTCEISDAILKCTTTNNSITGGFIPDLNLFNNDKNNNDNWNLIGEVFTVKMVDTKNITAPKLEGGHFVDQVIPGSILVISSPSHVKSASFGGLLALGAAKRGVKGVIIDGRCRDLNELKVLDLPILAKGHSTLGQSPFTRPSEIQIPIIISPSSSTSSESNSTWPSITIYPYDIILADIDGVIVVRPEMIEQVLKIAEVGRKIDALCREDLENGKGVGETFKLRRS